MVNKHVERFIEFFFIGLVMGIAEDLIAVWLATGTTPFNWRIVGIVAFVALPFAAFSELIVDREDFFNFLKRKKKEKVKEYREVKAQ